MAVPQMDEVVEQMVRIAKWNGGRVTCCAAQNSVKRRIPGKLMPYSQRSVLRYLCSDAIVDVLDRNGLGHFHLRLKHKGLGAHDCPCDRPNCSLPFKAFRGVSILLVPHAEA